MAGIGKNLVRSPEHVGQGVPDTLLSADRISFSFRSGKALSQATLSLRPSEIVALTGPSGSGKSTLMHCLAGLITPSAGTVAFNGEDIGGWSDRRRTALRRRSFGFIFQSSDLVPELTLSENVALPLRLNGVGRREAKDRAQGYLENLGLGEISSRRPGQTSGGQMQRAAVARALAHQPSVLFADEPTGAIDSANGEQVMRLIRRAAQEAGAAVLLVTHDGRVASYADREVRIKDGVTYGGEYAVS